MSRVYKYKKRISLYYEKYNILFYVFTSFIAMLVVVLISRSPTIANTQSSLKTSDTELDEQRQIIEVNSDSLCSMLIKVERLRAGAFSCNCGDAKRDKLVINIPEGSTNIASTVFFNEKLFSEKKYKEMLGAAGINVSGDTLIQFPVYKRGDKMAVRIPSETLYNLIKEIVSK